jgi:hypothetical protein
MTPSAFDGYAKIASMMPCSNSELWNKLLRSFRLSAPLLSSDELTAGSPGLRFHATNAYRRMRGIWVAGLDHIRVGDRRKRQVAGIFDRRRRRIGNRNVRRKRRDIARRNARLGRGRLGNLLRIVKFFQSESPCRHAPLAALSSRSRMMNSVNAISPSGFRKKRPAVWNLESRGRVHWPSSSPRVAFRGTTCRHGQTGKVISSSRLSRVPLNCSPRRATRKKFPSTF